jgi:hypothetical protein
VLLHGCYSGVTVVLQWCYSGVTVVFMWCSIGVISLLFAILVSFELSYSMHDNQGRAVGRCHRLHMRSVHVLSGVENGLD